MIEAVDKDKPLQLELGVLSNSYKLKDKSFKHFKIQIPEKIYDGNQDLIVKVQSPELYGDPDIYISKINEKPTSYDNSQWVCSTFGKDTCAISHKNITKDDIFYVGVRCFQACRFTILPSLTKEILIEDGIEIQEDFQTLETKIFKFYIPSNAGVQDEQNQVTSVTITAAPYLPTAEYLLLAASTKENVIPTSASRKGVPGWRKGQTLRLSKHSPQEWCTDCWITILVDVMDSGKYHISAKSNIGIMQIHQDKKVDDVAFFGDKVCYKYYVKNKDYDVNLRVAQFSGQISYSLHPGKLPNDYNSSAFKNIQAQNSILTISPRERQEVQQQTGLYYLCVFPHMTSTYSLHITEIPRNLQFSYIEDGYDENGEIQGNQSLIYVYKVPPLEYEGEDIKLEFIMTTISGTRPSMAAKFCSEMKDHKKCAQDIDTNEIFQSNSEFKKAFIVDNNLALSIDHDERQCQEVYNGQCYYTIVIQGQGEEQEYSKFSIKVSHSQQNYHILQEGKLITDFVNLGTYRYYSFTLPSKDKVHNVTFRLSTIHGDADIYVSRKDKYPNKSKYEKSSMRTNEIADEVFFDDDNIASTYYIAVYSYQYSTYNLIAQVNRNSQSENIPLLIEGMPIKGLIKKVENSEQYKIQIKYIEGYEKSITIHTTPLQGKIKMFVNYEQKAIPQSSFWEQFQNKQYSYQILYYTTESYIYLQSSLGQENQQLEKTNSYFRHFVVDSNKDISLSMTVFSGEPQLYVSFTSTFKFPNSTHNDFSIKGQQSFLGKSKALYFAVHTIQQLNPACQNDKTETDPCTLFATVYCQLDCKYTLKLQYENSGPQQMIIGVPIHDIIKDGTMNYYYLNVRYNKTKEIYSVLSSWSGNADLYVSFQDNPGKIQVQDWLLPSQTSYELKSSKFQGQDILKIKPSELDYCFSKYETTQDGEEKECTIIYGIYAPPQSLIPLNAQNETKDIDKYHTRYNFIVFTDMVQLMNQSPMNGQVDFEQLQYFLYESTCDDCTLLISVTTLTSGDPDVYVNFGDQRLPTKRDSDFESSTFQSELFNINLKNSYFKNSNKKSMKGPYIIGVYGTKKSNFTIQVSEENNPIREITMQNQEIKHNQDPFTIVYYLWYNWKEETDFKVQLSIRNGMADIYMTTYNESNEQDDLISKMAKSKRDAQWVLENINPLSNIEESEILIVNQEVNYCSKCYYVIGIVTHEKRTDYSLLVDILDADYENARFMKIGENYRLKMNATETKILRFIIQETQNVAIHYNVYHGKAKTTLSLFEPYDNVIGTLKNKETFYLNTKDDSFKIDQIYYLSIHAENEAELWLSINQELGIMRLKDGVPRSIIYNNGLDRNKYLTFNLPEGDITLNIQVKSKTKFFNPMLYYEYYEDLGKNVKKLDFPPGGKPGFMKCTNWDYGFGIMTCQQEFKNVIGVNAGLALNLRSTRETLAPNSEAIITLSSSPILKLFGGAQTFGSLHTKQSFIIYQIDDSLIKNKGKYIQIEFSQCFGLSEYSFIENPQNLYRKSEIKIIKQFNQYGREYAYIEVPQDNLFILVKPKVFEDITITSETQQKTDFLIKVVQTDKLGVQNYDYHLPNDGKINFEINRGKMHVEWGNLLKKESTGAIKQIENPYYYISLTKNSRARMDSICAVKEDYTKQHDITVFKRPTHELNYDEIQENTNYYLNVFAQINIDGEYDFIPYKPVTIIVSKFSNFLMKLILGILIIAFGVLLFIAYRYQSKVKTTTKQIEFEMADVRNIANIHDYEKSKIIEQKQRQERYSSLVSGVIDTTIDGVDEQSYLNKS